MLAARFPAYADYRRLGAAPQLLAARTIFSRRERSLARAGRAGRRLPPGGGRRGAARGVRGRHADRGGRGQAAGCALGQIVKSLVFVCDGRPVLALVPGDRRADPDKIARAAGAAEARIARAGGGRGGDRLRAGRRRAVPARRASRACWSTAPCWRTTSSGWAPGSPRTWPRCRPAELVRLARAGRWTSSRSPSIPSGVAPRKERL